MRKRETMREKNVYTLDKDDDKAVQLFVKLGMQKNLAKTLLYISQCDNCNSAEIEQAIDMRQPEVSVVMQELYKRGWVQKQDLKKKGKGRPVCLYKCTAPLSEILKTFEQEKLQEIESLKNDISLLKNIIKIHTI